MAADEESTGPRAKRGAAAYSAPDLAMVEHESLQIDRALVPRGVADRFWNDAYERRRFEAELLELFRTWGYGDVIPPMFEFAEVYSTRANARLQSQVYRFLDKDGATLVLRADMTLPVARLVGTRLHDWPMPQRYCYAGSVFRYTEPQAGLQREFWQAGVEIIGASGPEADAEVLALTAHALQLAKLGEFRLAIGQMAYFAGLLAELRLAPSHEEALLRAVDRNSEAQLAEFLRDVPLQTNQRRAVEELPHLSGNSPDRVIQRASRSCLNHRMQMALANLRSICDLLDMHSIADTIYLDLTEIHNLGYYTGITFEALVPQMGFPIGGGGRYDQLLATFGSDQPAVGVALSIDRILHARSQQAAVASARTPVAPDLLINVGNDRHCLDIVNQLRAKGLRIAVSVNGCTGKDLHEHARRLRIPASATWTGDGFEFHTHDSRADDAPLRLPAEEWSQLMTLAAANRKYS